ncbi:MAG TPA: DUF302 domain-containing protein [Bacteroidota bacterium]|nr:DUF302 domain-containing protein [Bacteroidota bacterium]
MHYGISKVAGGGYEDTVTRVTGELKKEGFGVLTTIDVRETLKKRLDVDFPRYVILGACNPLFAHEALQAEEEIGLLLPCNVIVYEKGDRTMVSAFDPTAMSGIVDNPAMEEIAVEMKRRLERVIAAV